jgi:hypothetical protein
MNMKPWFISISLCSLFLISCHKKEQNRDSSTSDLHVIDEAAKNQEFPDYRDHITKEEAIRIALDFVNENSKSALTSDMPAFVRRHDLTAQDGGPLWVVGIHMRAQPNESQADDPFVEVVWIPIDLRPRFAPQLGG